MVQRIFKLKRAIETRNPGTRKYFLKGKKLVTCHSLRDQAGVHINPPIVS